MSQYLNIRERNMRSEGGWDVKDNLDLLLITHDEINLCQSSLSLPFPSSPPFIYHSSPLNVSFLLSSPPHILVSLFILWPRKNSCKSPLTFLGPQVLPICLLGHFFHIALFGKLNSWVWGPPNVWPKLLRPIPNWILSLQYLLALIHSPDYS